MAAGDTWLVSILTGAVSHVTNGIEADAMEASGQWKAFPTQAAAQAYAAENVAARYAGYVESPVTSAAGAAGSALSSALLPHFTSGQWRAYALRGLKIAVGIILVIVGLVQLTHAQTLITDVAGAAATAKAV
jgi:hypothetical protein